MKHRHSKTEVCKGLSLIIVPFVVYSIGLIPPIISLKFFFNLLDLNEILHLIVLSFILFFEFLFFFFSQVVTTAFFINILKLKYEEGVYELTLSDPTFFKFALFSALYLPLIKLLKLLCLEPLAFIYVKLLGAKIGKNVILVGRINDPCLTEIGDNSVIGGHSIISAHTGEDKLILKRVKIGKNCIVGGWAHIMPGVTMEDNSVLGARSLATKNMVLKSYKVYGGVPAREIKAKRKFHPRRENII
jgi:acetyltransferase-like isoleucine patch superfamily enzyme